MENHTLLVLAHPSEPQLAMLEHLPPETNIAAGDSLEAVAGAAARADVILNWSLSGGLLRDVFRICPQLAWVHTRSAGLDRVLFPELVTSPVTLTNGSGVFSPALGEFALAAILFFAKGLGRMVRSREQGLWDPFDIAKISGQTVGIVGYGDIGRTVATRVRPMGMRVLAMTRTGAPLDPIDPLVSGIYAPHQLPEFLAQCDYVAVATPLTPETRGMIGAEAFAAMKPEAVVINLGRGPVIDETAMIEALAAQKIKGAALDVFDREPLPEGHPLYRLENVLLSPHCADHTPDWKERAMQFFIDQFHRFHDGQPLLNVVDKQRGY